MGAWSFVEPRLRELLPASLPLSYVGREEAASPATGIHHLHEAEEKALLEDALDVAAGPASTLPLPAAKSPSVA